MKSLPVFRNVGDIITPSAQCHLKIVFSTKSGINLITEIPYDAMPDYRKSRRFWQCHPAVFLCWYPVNESFKGMRFDFSFILLVRSHWFGIFSNPFHKFFATRSWVSEELFAQAGCHFSVYRILINIILCILYHYILYISVRRCEIGIALFPVFLYRIIDSFVKVFSHGIGWKSCSLLLSPLSCL